MPWQYLHSFWESNPDRPDSPEAESDPEYHMDIEVQILYKNKYQAITVMSYRILSDFRNAAIHSECEMEPI